MDHACARAAKRRSASTRSRQTWSRAARRAFPTTCVSRSAAKVVASSLRLSATARSLRWAASFARATACPCKLRNAALMARRVKCPVARSKCSTARRRRPTYCPMHHRAHRAARDFRTARNVRSAAALGRATEAAARKLAKPAAIRLLSACSIQQRCFRPRAARTASERRAARPSRPQRALAAASATPIRRAAA